MRRLWRRLRIAYHVWVFRCDLRFARLEEPEEHW